MSALDDARREAFARQLALGFSPTQASLNSGYRRGKSVDVEKRQARPDVMARVAELRQEKARAAADLVPIIELLMEAATQAGKLDAAQGFTAQRGLLAEAARLKGLLAPPPFTPSLPVERDMTDEEWLAAFAPKSEAAP